MVSKKAQKLINELNELLKKENGKCQGAYEKRLLSLTEEEAELLSISYFESDDAVEHWSHVKALF